MSHLAAPEALDKSRRDYKAVKVALRWDLQLALELVADHAKEVLRRLVMNL